MARPSPCPRCAADRVWDGDGATTRCPVRCLVCGRMGDACAACGWEFPHGAAVVSEGPSPCLTCEVELLGAPERRSAVHRVPRALLAWADQPAPYGQWRADRAEEGSRALWRCEGRLREAVDAAARRLQALERLELQLARDAQRSRR